MVYLASQLKQNTRAMQSGTRAVAQFLIMVHAARNAWEVLYFEYQAGHLEQAFWESKARQIQFTLSSPSDHKAWNGYTQLFDERFVAYVNENVVP